VNSIHFHNMYILKHTLPDYNRHHLLPSNTDQDSR
jgi:hypothetical protein